MYLARSAKCLSQLQRWLLVTVLLAWRVSLGGCGGIPFYLLRRFKELLLDAARQFALAPMLHESGVAVGGSAIEASKNRRPTAISK